MVRKIIGFILIGIAVAAIASTSSDVSESLFPAIIFTIVGLILIFKKRGSKERKQKVAEARKLAKQKIYASHQAGLPLSQGSQCELEYTEDKFIFSGSGNTFELWFDKITDICIKTDREIQTQYVSSMGGAVAGAVVFGPLGAIVGGRAKKKKLTQIAYYFIYTYKKNDEISYISFEISNFETQKAFRWISDFNANYRSNQAQTVVL